MPLEKGVDIGNLAKKTETFTGADVAAVCNEAAILSIRKYVLSGGSLKDDRLKQMVVTNENFLEAMEKIRPTSRIELEKYRKIAKEFEYVG